MGNGDLKKSMSRLFWLSFVLLFAEILCIRWLGFELIIVRIFPNLIVMAALVSTSTGLIAQAREKTTGIKKRLWIDNDIALAIAACLLLSSAIFSVPWHLTDLSVRFETASPTTIAAAVTAIFSVIGCVYILFRRIGYLLGGEFEKHEPLKAYSVNLLGSIVGTLAIGIVSWFSLPPSVALLVLAAAVFSLADQKKVKALCLGVGLVFSVLAFVQYKDVYWSPYSKLTVTPVKSDKNTVVGPGSFVLNSNNAYFHTGMRILPKEKEAEFLAKKPISEQDKTILWYYSRNKTPFECAPRLDDVLVLGAGSGNDVAYGLMRGVKKIDGVEIDPVIATFGKIIHPNKPWADPRATVHNEDARTYLRYSDRKYDLVLFANLDPGATINTASFLRVDNFVYTVESMRSALRMLKPDGLIALSFATGPDSIITDRLYKTIETASGAKPMAFVDEEWDSVLFLFGPGAATVDAAKVLALEPALKPWPPADRNTDTRACTDDWPFLYTNFHMEGMVLYFSVLLVAVVVPALLTILGTPQGSSISPGEWGNMFFLGQAFMLVETKSITQLSLLFGATWLVSSIVILTILILAWLANLVVMKLPKAPLAVLYAGLFLCLLADFFFTVPETTNLPPLALGAMASLFACCPILFGSMTFSRCFKDTKRPLELLSANLLGVAFGGLTENLCLWFGIKGLPIIGMVLYGLSGVCLLIHQRRKKDQSS